MQHFLFLMASLDVETDMVLVVQKYPSDLVVLSPRVGGSRDGAAVPSQGVWEACVCMYMCVWGAYLHVPKTSHKNDASSQECWEPHGIPAPEASSQVSPTAQG